MKNKLIKIFSLTSLMCTVFALIAVLTINNKNQQEEVEQGQLVVDTEIGKDPGSVLRLNANSNIESGITSVIVTATLSPNYAQDKTLTWSLAWASSKTGSVTDYVKKEVSEDTLSCTLTYLQQFDTQIVLTATSNATSTVTASCTVDCYTRSKNMTSQGIMFGSDMYTASNGVLDLTSVSASTIFTSSVTLHTDQSSFAETVIGTIGTTPTYTFQLSLSDELKEALTNAGISFTDYVDDLDNSNTSNQIVMGGIRYMFVATNLSEMYQGTIYLRDGVAEVLQECQNWFTLTWTVTDTYNSNQINEINGSVDLLFDVTDVLVVTSMSLDKSSYIF